ncbi:MAG: hypothetical protein K5855_04410 [Oscillospiraceae bacterium]|nr:hypothetical protein [Oscillospiraceae bacterium]
MKRLVPILAAGSATFNAPEVQEERDYPPASAFLTDKKKRFLPGTLGLADPDIEVMLPARANKVTPLFNALRPF